MSFRVLHALKNGLILFTETKPVHLTSSTNKIKIMTPYKLIYISALLFTLNLSCQQKEKEPVKVTVEGANKICSQCHLAPNPNILPKSGWKALFKKKRTETFAKLGILKNDQRETARPYPRYRLAEQISLDELAQLEKHFVSNAPDKAIAQTKTAHQFPASTIFKKSFEQLSPNAKAGGVLSLSVSKENNRIYMGGLSFLSKKPLSYIASSDLTGKLKSKTEIGFPAVKISKVSDKLLISLIGEDVPSCENKKGKVLLIDPQTLEQANTTVSSLASNLFRPVDAQLIGGNTLLVQEFGCYEGGLSTYKRNGSSQSYIKDHEIISAPGGVGFVIHDFNNDGLDDLATLISQESETLFLCLQNRSGRYNCENIFQGHPSFGFSSISLVDINKDGLMDLITTNGDNLDIDGMPLKPYHGVRIFLADMNHSGFSSPPIFLPLHGAYHTSSEDFDLDGDIDIVAISYFPDFSRKELATAVIFENDGALNFTPRLIPDALHGLGVTVKSSDLDKDGDADLIIGAVSSPYTEQKWNKATNNKRPYSFIILDNQTIR